MTPTPETPSPDQEAGSSPPTSAGLQEMVVGGAKLSPTSQTLSRIEQVSVWMEALRRLPRGMAPETLDAALEELNAAHEELRVAEEELILQNEELQLVQLQVEAERERYRALFELAPDGYIVTDFNGMIREANETACTLFCVPQRFLRGKPLLNFVATQYRSQFRSLLSQLLENRRVSWETIIQPRLHLTFPASITVSMTQEEPSRDYAQGIVLRWLIRNTSEQERTAHQLAQVNLILHTLVNAAPLPIIVIDQERQVTVWNPAAERFFEWTATEVLGSPMPIIVPSRQREFERRHEELYAGVSHQGIETQRLRKDGSVVDVAIWTAPLRNENGLVISTVWLIVDISERKRTEEARRQLLERVVMAQEEERARISRDLHDHLGQYLTGIMLGLQALESQGTELPYGERRSNAEQLAKLRSIVDELMLASHRQAWELRPAELDDMGLASAVHHYVSDWSARSNITADFYARGFDGHRLEGTVEITLYRVIQEALTNVLRHAQASRVGVILELNTHTVTAIIEDDGRGFESSVEETMQKGRLGLTGMSERLALVGGTLDIESSPGQGTTVFARVPQPRIRTNESDSPDIGEVKNP